MRPARYAPRASVPRDRGDAAEPASAGAPAQNIQPTEISPASGIPFFR